MNKPYRRLGSGLGLALRPSVFEPELLGGIIKQLDKSNFTSLWFPDLGVYDSVELAAYALAATTNMWVGTGVTPFSSHDPAYLGKRALTLSSLSDGRFILGIGSGRAGGVATIRSLTEFIGELRKRVGKDSTPVIMSGLRPRMIMEALKNSDGVLLNFSYAPYIKRVLGRAQPIQGKMVAGYIKLYFAESDQEAYSMMHDEFQKYASYPNYRSAFQEMGVLNAIASLPSQSGILEKISLANPNYEKTAELVKDLREAGVIHPVIYPYVSGDEYFKLKVIEKIAEWSMRLL